MPMLEPSTPDAFTAKLAALDPAGWTASASDQSPSYPAGNVVDGSPTTFWHSLYSPTPTPLPHSITVDLKTVRDVSGVTYLPRQDGSPNGTIGRYAVATSTDGTHWSDPVVSGTWNDDPRQKSAVFPSVRARFVRLDRADGGRRSRTMVVRSRDRHHRGPPAGPPLPRTGWTVVASDASPSYPAQNVLDGNGTTIWHTRFGAVTTPLPHTLTVDLGAPTTVTGLRYLPRQDTSPNGTIGRYAVSVSTDGPPGERRSHKARGPTTRPPKTAGFAAATARYVRLTALSEAGSRGPWTSAAEIDVLGAPPAPASGGCGARRSACRSCRCPRRCCQGTAC